MQNAELLRQKARSAEEVGNLRAAARWYKRAAAIAIQGEDHELASELYMRAAVCLEQVEEWRQIGVLWLHVAAALQGQSDPIGKGRYVDAAASGHSFPTIDTSHWRTLSRPERIGRALRNSGYHLEKAGTNQSAYKQYEMAGSVFRNAGLWDEASRSYMLAARSYIVQHGELDTRLLEDLEHSLEQLREQNQARYLRRLIFYYRGLRADLTERGNTEQANCMYVYECRAKTRLHGLENRQLAKLGFQIWNTTSRYGTSFPRWALVSAVLTFVVFPPLHLLVSGDRGRTLGNLVLGAFMTSINTFLGQSQLGITNPWGVNIVILAELLAGYIMLGSLIAMIIARITR